MFLRDFVLNIFIKTKSASMEQIFKILMVKLKGSRTRVTWWHLGMKIQVRTCIGCYKGDGPCFHRVSLQLWIGGNVWKKKTAAELFITLMAAVYWLYKGSIIISLFIEGFEWMSWLKYLLSLI